MVSAPRDAEDPNFPPNLSIAPSSNTFQPHSAGPRDGDSGDEDAEQDIETYGIAGRTWEAAYLLRQYLTPIEPSPNSIPIEFDPPCPLYPVCEKTSRRRTILEIGSGTGFLGLSLAPHLSSTDTLVLTDLENVCPLLDKNLSDARHRWRNRRRRSTHTAGEGSSSKPDDEPTCLVRPLPWGDLEFLNSEIKRAGLLPDVILASDLVYFPFLYPPLLRTLLGLTEWQASDDPRRRSMQGPTLIFSYKIRSLVREQPFWEAFGRWFEFEAVQIGKFQDEEEDEAKDGGDRDEMATAEKKDDPVSIRRSKTRTWSRFGAAHKTGSGRDDSDELYIFIAHRRIATLGVSDLINRGGVSYEDLMLGRNGLEGELHGGAQFEEMLLASLEWD
ncbi:hypothetical protein JCM3766R1_003885 [Sporobolomyces carnicolor]